MATSSAGSDFALRHFRVEEEIHEFAHAPEERDAMAMGNFKIYTPWTMAESRARITAPAMLLSFLSAALYTSRGFPFPSPLSLSLSPFEIAMDSYYYDGRSSLLFAVPPVLRGERENGPGKWWNGEIPFWVFRRRSPKRSRCRSLSLSETPFSTLLAFSLKNIVVGQT